MSQREALSPEVQDETAVHPAHRREAAGRDGERAELGAPAARRLDRLLGQAPPADPRILADLVCREAWPGGRPANGNGAAPPDRCRQLVTDVLAGRAAGWPPVGPAAASFFDPLLDDTQRDAVARALATPDFFLLQGLPGTGKSRVTAEIVAQAAARGERVLLLAPSGAALDRTLELVSGRDGCCAVRCVGPDENGRPLSPVGEALTFGKRRRAVCELAAGDCRRYLQELEDRRARLRGDEAILGRFDDLAAEQERLSARARALGELRQAVGGEVEALAQQVELSGASLPVAQADEPFVAGLLQALAAAREAARRADDELARIGGQINEARSAAEDRERRLEEIRPLVEAWANRRWWRPSWWRALFRRRLAGTAAQIEADRRRLAAAVADLETEAERFRQQRATAQREGEAGRTRCVQAEVARRQAELDGQLAAVRQELEVLREKWRLACADLAPETPRPTEIAPAAVAAARAEWRQALERVESQGGVAREWARRLAEAADALAERAPAAFNIVAATTAALPGDPHFGDAAPAGHFDLLVLEGAERVTESEFTRLGRRAGRWVLVGEAPAPSAGGAEPPGAARGRPPVARPGRAPVLQPALFQRLWQQLRWDPCRIAYSWVQERNRLCCRLLPLAPGQSRHVETEPVADFPDIELRILAQPRTTPQLAEVVFPPSMSLAQAKEYIFRELDELPVRPAGGAWRWQEGPERLTLYLADEPNPAAVAVRLEEGVSEFVLPFGPGASAAAGPPAGSTCRIEFDLGRGWHRARAEEWVRHHLPTGDLGRTGRLTVPYRMHPDLAAFVSDVLFAGGYQVAAPSSLTVADGPRTQGPRGPADTGANGWLHHVEFVPVPCVAVSGMPPRKDGKPAGPNRGNGPRRRGEASGAGLEVDLTDPRHRDRLPAELRPHLPPKGVVNYLEAQSVVKKLETLVHAAEEAPGGASAPPAVAVIALYPAQAALIRLLARGRPALASRPGAFVIDVPEAFREREYRVVLLSLTRSHSHRAVPFGDGPDSLALALTRARTQLVLFGDVGTLLRRGEWEGPLEHLDALSGARERRVIGKLAAYLRDSGRHQEAFSLAAT